MQNSTNSVVQWCNANHQSINAAKTQHMILTLQSNIVTLVNPFTIRNEPISQTKTAKLFDVQGPLILHRELKNMQLSFIHTTGIFHNCNNFFHRFIYRQRFSQQFFQKSLCSVVSCARGPHQYIPDKQSTNCRHSAELALGVKMMHAKNRIKIFQRMAIISSYAARGHF